MSQLKQEITLFSGIGQMSTTLLGTGLFMVPAIAAGIAGAYSLWAWLLLFVAICPIALTFAQLGKRFPNAGGTAYFVRQAFNIKLEKSVAWLFISVTPVGVPPAIALASSFLQQVLPEPLSVSLLAQFITISLLVIVNLRGAQSSGRLQSFIALGILTLIISFWWKGGITTNDLVLPSLSAENLPSIGVALAVMFWCFVGIEAFAHMGEEFKNPQRDFPIAIVAGCFLAGAVYWVGSVVILKMGAFGTREFDSASIPWVAEQLFGKEVKIAISLIGFAACFASLNLYLQSLSRMVWSQAREYRPASRMAKLTKRGVPGNATLLVAGVALISCILGTFSGVDLEFFLKLANGIFVLVYLLAMLAAIKLLVGFNRILAALSLVLCAGVFLCLGISMLYAVAVFGLLNLPWKKWNTYRLLRSNRM
ncbi:L-methionine/branched-chain amino acid transporter [Vibrio caribbeanicus]|uniref:L-methionine/branched-chain amino acid transporter n=1 Tax=Vibrio caribbeanicus TaxID=701175 RepID=UPI0030DC711A